MSSSIFSFSLMAEKNVRARIVRLIYVRIDSTIMSSAPRPKSLLLQIDNWDDFATCIKGSFATNTYYSGSAHADDLKITIVAFIFMPVLLHLLETTGNENADPIATSSFCLPAGGLAQPVAMEIGYAQVSMLEEVMRGGKNREQQALAQFSAAQT